MDVVKEDTSLVLVREDEEAEGFDGGKRLAVAATDHRIRQ